MSPSAKKVIVRRFVGDVLHGYLQPSGFVRRSADSEQAYAIDLLDLSGRVVVLPMSEIKVISFVRDFNLSDTRDPERLSRRTFLARPRTEGLWLRLTFRSGDQIEGLATADLSLLDGAIEDAGVYLSPPDPRSNTQRLFVPRSAIAELLLLAIVTTPSRRKADPKPEPSLQEELFGGSVPPDSRPN